MTDLDPATILERAPDLSVRVHANDEAVVSLGGRSVTCGRHTLAVLDAFARPCRFADAVAALQPRAAGTQDWVELTRTIHTLHQAGFLTDADRPEGLPPVPRQFDDLALHVGMLDDETRTSSFLAGINEVVRPGDVVVDLGTGTGVLAVAAARAGARHVYAIEAGAIGDAARTLFERNGVADRVTLVAGWSQQVALPERADVLVTETVGHDPFAEHVLESVRDARTRLLVPGARFVPGTIRLSVLPVAVPARVVAEHRVTPQAAARWRSRYGVDFDSLAGEPPQVWLTSPAKARRWKAFAAPVVVTEIDLATLQHAMIDASAEFTVDIAGRLNAILVFFELQISPTVALSSGPGGAGADSSWRCPVWLLPEPLAVQPGDRFTVSYRHRAGADQGVSVARI